MNTLNKDEEKQIRAFKSQLEISRADFTTKIRNLNVSLEEINTAISGLDKVLRIQNDQIIIKQ